MAVIITLGCGTQELTAPPSRPTPAAEERSPGTPVAAQPEKTRPGETRPGEARPATGKPADTEPAASEPPAAWPTPKPMTGTGPAPEPAAVRSTGVCERSKALQKAISSATGGTACPEVTWEQLARIETIILGGELPAPGDLAGMNGLRRLEVRNLTSPITRNAFAEAGSVTELNILIGEPEEGQEANYATLENDAFRDMERLRDLTVSGVDGWTKHEITGETLRGLGNLRTLRIDYVESIDGAAFRHTPRLREISLHGTRREHESHPRIHREMFSGLGQLRMVEMRNFRWPPVLDVRNEAVACSAAGWLSFKSGEPRGKMPLSVLTEGGNGRPRDVESMPGCGEAR